MIRITRVSNSARFRFYKIFIDDVYRGKIDVDETKEFEVENGTHTVYAKLDWGRSNKLCVHVNDSIINLEVSDAVTGWKNLFLIVYATFLAHKSLLLKEVESVDTSLENRTWTREDSSAE